MVVFLVSMFLNVMVKNFDSSVDFGIAMNLTLKNHPRIDWVLGESMGSLDTSIFLSGKFPVERVKTISCPFLRYPRASFLQRSNAYCTLLAAKVLY